MEGLWCAWSLEIRHVLTVLRFLAGNSWSRWPTQPLCPLHPCLVVVANLSCHTADMWKELSFFSHFIHFISSNVTPLSSRSLKSVFFALVPPGLRAMTGTWCTRHVQNNRMWKSDVKGIHKWNHFPFFSWKLLFLISFFYLKPIEK